LTTKIHLAALSEDVAASALLSPGCQSDFEHFPAVYEQACQRVDPKAVVTDKGYDSNAIREQIQLVGGGERRLLIMGDGPERSNLERKAQGLKGVDFVGFVKKGDQRRYWQEALFSVVPSIWMEPFGMTVLESWSNGRPVVAHAIGALPEIIREGVDGTLADPEKVEDFAHKLDGLLSNPKQAESMGLAGRRHLEDYFSRSRWLKEIATIYDDLLLTR